MAKLLSNLKEIKINGCDVIEEVVSNRDDEDDEVVVSTTSANQTTNLLFHLDSLRLKYLPNLKCIGGGGAKTWSTNQTSFNNTTADQFKLSEVNVASWSLCQYTREIDIDSCEALPYVVPSYAVGQMQKLENLTIWDCNSMVEVFETQRISTSGCGTTTNIDEGSSGPDATMVIPRLKVINVPQLFNLKKLWIFGCDLLEYVFTSSTIESLMQLEWLHVTYCKAMKVIVKEENGEHTLMTSKAAVFPRLKSIHLGDLPNLEGFFLGMNVFQWPLLDDVTIDDCPQMMVFTAGRSIAPNLKYIHTELGKHSLECGGLNFRAMANLNQTSLEGTNSCHATSLKEMRLAFHNLIEVHVKWDYDLQSVFPSNKLLQLQKMEKIRVTNCSKITEVFGTILEGEDISFKSVVEIPNLREVELEELDNLKYIWKNNPWMVLQFPNLTKLSIRGCWSMEHVFTTSMVGSLLQLQELFIEHCPCMEVIVKEGNAVVQEEEERDDGKVNEIRLSMCDLVEEISEAPERPDRELQSVVVKLPNLRQVKLQILDNLKYIWKNNPWMVLEFPNLTKLSIFRCWSMEHVFTSSMVGSLLQLQQLHICRCECMEVIVKEANVVVQEEDEGKVNQILTLPRLKSLTLKDVPKLKGFCLGKEAFSWPSLDTLEINECPTMSVFTKGDLATPELRLIDTSLGRCELAREESLNSFIKTAHEKGFFNKEDSDDGIRM